MDVFGGLPLPQRYWAILVISLGTALSVIDSTIVNVALPTIARELQITSASSILIINAYQLAVTASLLPLAALGDIVGYRRVAQGGLALFIVASIGCALADSLALLATARVFQGLGAAGVMSVSSALVRSTYPSNQLGRGIGINSMVVATSSALGPTLGGAMLSFVSWPWLFAINIPIGVAAFLIGWRCLPVNTTASENKFDTPSAILNALTFGLFSVGVSGLGHGQPASIVALELGCTLLIGFLFVQRQLTQKAPLLPVDLLRQPILALSFTTSLCSFIAQMLVLIALPFYLQNGIGLTPVQSGLMMIPWPLTVALMAPVAGYLADRYAAGVLGSLGLVIAATGISLILFLPAHAAAHDIMWRMALCGVGFGLFQTPNTRIIISSSPRERTGSIGGMIGTVRLTGQTIGAALAALIFNLVPERGSMAAVLLAVIIALLAAGFSAIRIRLAKKAEA